MDIHKRVTTLAGLRSGQQYRIWVEERKLFHQYILRLRELRELPDDVRDELESLNRYFQKFPGAE